MLLLLTSVSGCVNVGVGSEWCAVMEAMHWPANVSPIQPNTDTEATVISTNEYGAKRCDWKPLGE